ncbi:MAG: hypothetical protein KZQ73_14760 [Candidatus Thiodiazotropha sp. (ex Semelilucina semeliformis)]|nr:hypothetical protein [Candidatus Thiodiazotropha sp. (ex Semelilucina semeliformis)]MCU7830169.1 hypothetical protein [Candidatus Thiodiazotropha sp. (ex Myrtea sp. 'scaly one' KF741663)]
MFNYLEKKSEKRIFYSYLHRFGLTWEDLNPRVSRLILNAIYDQAQATSHKFGEPLETVSGNIISAAAWGTIYCLMGSDQMLKMEPGYRDIVDEVEWELMISCEKEDAGSNIYCRVFSILYENGHCHPSVSTLLKACMHQAPSTQSFEAGNCSVL